MSLLGEKMTQVRHQKIHSTQNGDCLKLQIRELAAQTMRVANTQQVVIVEQGFLFVCKTYQVATLF